ncbi:hypothetical protein [Prosthecomicrobium pneumaticum]|uniref:Uncharacterized protein n=1 Tax=Prosthecomicrobium pneumaticum TaxID=81895 RepID=A0A7W9FJQ1_9HYPH|nr:hypothetical protein [Prosthecomicrobium pneumaticum]MBB5751811.1 hypothetical protein [Prosthecomicrobium pneumaticum]
MIYIHRLGTTRTPLEGWRGKLTLVLATALGLAVAGALIVFSLGLALVLVPIVGLAWLFRGPLIRRAQRRMQEEATMRRGGPAPRGTARVIEVDYEVLPADEHRRP